MTLSCSAPVFTSRERCQCRVHHPFSHTPPPPLHTHTHTHPHPHLTPTFPHRDRRKLQAIRDNAAIYLAIDLADRKKGEPLGAGFARWLWSYVDGHPVVNTAVWTHISKTPTVSEVRGRLVLFLLLLSFFSSKSERVQLMASWNLEPVKVLRSNTRVMVQWCGCCRTAGASVVDPGMQLHLQAPLPAAGGREGGATSRHWRRVHVFYEGSLKTPTERQSSGPARFVCCDCVL